MDITVTDLAVEALVAKQCTTGLMQLGHQVPVGGIRRRIRQGHPRQRIQVAQARAREPQAQIEGAQVARIGQGAGQRDTGIGDLQVGLQRERQARILQRQQAADLAVAGERLAFVAPFDLEGKGVVLGGGAFLRRDLADNISEWDRLAQRIDNDIQAGFQRLIVKADLAFVETDGTDIQHPSGRLGLLILGSEIEGPVGPPIGQALERGGGLVEIDARNDNLLKQQRQGCQAKLDTLESSHLRLLEPVRVAQGQVFGDEARPGKPGPPTTLLRLALPSHGEITVDSEGPLQRFGDLGIEGRFDPVPVERRDDDYQ
ncbi:hypothetical protein D3C78_646770 [compost metagenome]